MILFLIVFIASHLGVMLIFKLTTYHAYFWKALPLLLAFAIFVGFSFYYLDLHEFFVWQFALASIWLFYIGYKNKKAANYMLQFAGGDSDQIRLMALSASRTASCYAYSSFIYIGVFSVSYLWLYNSQNF